MSIDTTTLNLTRKWRSKDFDSVVGQDLSIKIIKNSLYLGQFFPVYLFAGQRGCGKTTTARVFAAALNCLALPDFQKNPKTSAIPCLQCASCSAMARGNHPDFSEIDAASHTGVDTIRTIIEAAQLLPLMGSKKIYLIDEAHMLSKASCNALLKILEEPPPSVVFMLATTDPQKIIETVRSRCFQLLFKAVATPTLLNHLIQICAAESIAYEEDALHLIIQETDGSVRDALNLLEQVRFSQSTVSKPAVLSLLGHLDDGHLVELLKRVVTGQPGELLQFLHTIKSSSWSADFIWRRFIELLRSALWIKYGVAPDQFVQYTDTLQVFLRTCPVDVIHGLLDSFYTKESVFLRTTSKHALLEVILLQFCKKNNYEDDSSTGTPVCVEGSSVSLEVVPTSDDEEVSDTNSEEQDSYDMLAREWQRFVEAVQTLKDPLISSIFKQGRCVAWEKDLHTVTVEFSKELSFFNDSLQETKPLWLPLLQKSFGVGAQCNAQFVVTTVRGGISSGVKTISTREKHTDSVAKKVPEIPKKTSYPEAYTSSVGREQRVDIRDALRWPKATLVHNYFPGVITEIKSQQSAEIITDATFTQKVG